VDKSPVYIVEKKLGKGGFGQVYVGRRAQQTKASPAGPRGPAPPASPQASPRWPHQRWPGAPGPL